MTARIAIDLNRLPAALQRRERAVLRVLHQAAEAAARRYRAELVAKTPRDTGHMAAAWKVKVAPPSSVRPRLRELVSVLNDAPYADVIERGARPHKVSPEGWMAIYEWVRRHRASFGMVTASGRARPAPASGRRVHSGLARGGADLNAELASITWAIVKRINKRGARPRYIVRDSRANVQRYAAQEVKRLLARVAAQKDPR